MKVNSQEVHQEVAPLLKNLVLKLLQTKLELLRGQRQAFVHLGTSKGSRVQGVSQVGWSFVTWRMQAGTPMTGWKPPLGDHLGGVTVLNYHDQ